MAYTKQNFENGQTLKAEHLNNIESGIKNNETEISRLSKKFDELPEVPSMTSESIITALGYTPANENVADESVSFTTQELTEEQKVQARANIGAVSDKNLSDTVDAALTQAKESGQFDGEDGESLTFAWNGTTLVVSSADGHTEGVDLKGESGDDYVLTEDDKTEIAEMAADAVDIGDAKNAVLFTEQTLTEEQKAIVRANIGAKAEVEENNSDAGIDYTYDGDNESNAHTWISNASGNRHLVKVANVPDGGIDLVGCLVSVLAPEWPENNYSFTITRDMYSEASGLTQILYQNTAINDKTPIAMVVICTKVGAHDINLNGWVESLTFAETGIYFMDGRASWDGKYVASVFRSGTTDPEETEENPTEYNGNEIQVFNRGICVGDSITHGTVDHGEGQINVKHYSYPTILSKMTGINIVNTGVPGFTSKNWYDASIDGEAIGGSWVNNEWVWGTSPTVGENDVMSKSLNYSGFDFAVIHLGINDVLTVGYGETLESALSKFETNINNIITKLKNSNTGIKIFIATIIPSYAYDGSTEYATFNEKIREIANSTSDVYLIDLKEYSALEYNSPYSNKHLTAIGYYKMASEISNYISYIISKNLEDFKAVQFIGTEYSL